MVMSFGIFKTKSVLVCPTGHRLSRPPPEPPRPHHAQPTKQPSALGVPGERRGAAAKPRERRASKGTLQGRLAWSPGLGEIPEMGRAFMFSFASRGCFSYPLFLAFHLHGVAFCWDGTVSSSPAGFTTHILTEALSVCRALNSVSLGTSGK